MSESVLKALMLLFAIIAKVEIGENGVTSKSGEEILKHFLKTQLNSAKVKKYLFLFDHYLQVHHSVSQKPNGLQKKMALNSVKILRVCVQINEELTQKQKWIVVIRLLEFIGIEAEFTDQEVEFVTAVADIFNFTNEEFECCMKLVFDSKEVKRDCTEFLHISNHIDQTLVKAKQLKVEGLTGKITILKLKSVNLLLVRYHGNVEAYLNGQVINKERIFILTHGGAIRSTKFGPIYYSDAISSFLTDKTSEKIVFEAKQIEFGFEGGKGGIDDLSFVEESGKLIGIMGASGAGKSTLLNILNGTFAPDSGEVLINGIDIYKEPEKIQGLIGYVSQDDLLIEELSVFQNLFYNSKLCFGELEDYGITKRVLKLLSSLGLLEIKELKVGSALNKTISGGQRKRLNIGLEVIREPSVLFVDEPTSGLSSRDSENIMDLLKELALKNKLVFAVIHQPSSDIFKMFDKLLILDQGGYPIYYGDPVDAILYFKRQINHVNSSESECPSCGNVNPEQLFNIIESKVLDEYGNVTKSRRISPEEWNQLYKEKIETKNNREREEAGEIKEGFKIPSYLKQFKVFVVRDVISKLSNKQYVLINLLEAPVLAAILSFFVRFYKTGLEDSSTYVFRENENIPQFLFMSVVVALFVGLTVSAEEIIRDRKIRKRESFLNLSKGSYLLSKIVVVFTLSAIQTLLFVLVGNSILEIKEMHLIYWLVLFSVSCFANMLGLNISAMFDSPKVIYIIIPFLIIPQLLFSGIIVKFDKLIPLFSSQTSVPFIGNIMVSRWGYEALAVTQFRSNKYEKLVYPYDKALKNYSWKKDYWVKNLKNKISTLKTYDFDAEPTEEIEYKVQLIANELKKEKILIPNLNIDYLQDNIEYNATLVYKFDRTINRLDALYKDEFRSVDNKKDAFLANFMKPKEGKLKFHELQDNYKNDRLEEFVTDRNNLDVIVEYDGELIQKSNLIYLDPNKSGLFKAHFYAPRKHILGFLIHTLWANVIVMWLMTIALFITLYYDLFRKILGLWKIYFIKK